MPSPAPQRTVQSVDRAVLILDLLTQAPQGLSLSELARRANLPPQTAQSLLRTLQAHNLLTQEGRGTPYTLGPRVLEWARRWLGGRDLASVARAEVERLSDQLGEYVVLAELRDDYLAPLAEIQPDRTLSVRSELGGLNRLHSMATAKILLAYTDDTRRERILARMTFEPLGPNALRSADTLRRQLAAVRRAGQILCLEEAGEGIASAAVPVRDAEGAVAAALGVALPLVRFPRPARTPLLEALKQTASRIEHRWFGQSV